MYRNFFAGLQLGTFLFNRFELVKCLSAQNEGAVYLCLDIHDNSKLVALKVVATDMLASSVGGQRFQNEMRVAGLVSHPHVVGCEHFFRDETFTAFSMEYLERGALSLLLEKGISLSIDRVFELLFQLCSALEVIHSAGIIHRDLKPENVLCGKNGGVKISDFGISVIGDSITCGEEDVLVGTLNYLSPEYIQRGYYDRRSDIYSLGLIAYELVTGVQPIYGRSPLERLTMRVKHDPISPRTIRDECPQALNDVIVWSLQRDPEKRCPSAAALRSALNAAASSVSGHGTPILLLDEPVSEKPSTLTFSKIVH